MLPTVTETQINFIVSKVIVEYCGVWSTPLERSHWPLERNQAESNARRQLDSELERDAEGKFARRALDTPLERTYDLGIPPFELYI